tara:strand:+ start:38 stop:304 length:267 start_codon:yes stop_codon:yes gene_type:complete
MRGYKETSVNGTVDITVDAPAPEKKSVGPGFIVGMALAVAAAVSFEAVLVWVILAYLLKAKLAFTQVLGAVLIFEYALSRVMLKKDGL